jgi:antitoxin component of MazEF toxin-antitoxin module
MTVLVKKLGGSVAVVIPKSVAREMELRDGTSLDISTISGGILLRRNGRRARRPLDKLVAQLSPAAYRRRRLELGQDRPVGKEIW